MTRRRLQPPDANSLVLEATIQSDGRIDLAPSVRAELQWLKGKRVVVRVTTRREAKELEGLGVTEDLVDRITDRQREERGNVVRCLLSQGSLAGNRHLRAWQRGSKA